MRDCTISKRQMSCLHLLKPATLLKVTLLHGCFSRFLNCTKGTKSCKAPYLTFNSISQNARDRLNWIVLSMKFSRGKYFFDFLRLYKLSLQTLNFHDVLSCIFLMRQIKKRKLAYPFLNTTVRTSFLK